MVCGEYFSWPSLVAEVASMQPYDISWSNAIDYIFATYICLLRLSIAKKVSCDDMHSCDWTGKVLGTDIYQFYWFTNK